VVTRPDRDVLVGGGGGGDAGALPLAPPFTAALNNFQSCLQLLPSPSEKISRVVGGYEVRLLKRFRIVCASIGHKPTASKLLRISSRLNVRTHAGQNIVKKSLLVTPTMP
jgi:hypothetical protein